MLRSKAAIACVALGAIATLLAACGSSTVMTCEPWGTPAELAERPSPYDSLTLYSTDGLRAKLCYSRPFARGRVIFGGLVPFDTLWRTGANEPTILHLSRAAEIAGLHVPAGKYSLYTVPSAGDWSVVVNASTSQWGLTREERGAAGNLFPNAYTEDVRAREVGRAPIDTQAIPYVEQLTATLQSTDGVDANLYVDWETTRVVIPIRFLDDGS